jgi:hypothetical protein
MDGFVKFDTPKADALVVTYDDEKTTPAKIIEALKKGGLSPTGEPVNLN